MVAGDTSNGWKVAISVAVIGAVASIAAAVITQRGNEGVERDAASPTSTSQVSAQIGAEPGPDPTAPPGTGITSPRGTNSSQPSAGSTYIVDAKPVDRNVSFDDDPAVVNGVTYAHPLRVYHSKNDVFLEYNLGRSYSRFQAVAGVSDDSESVTRKRLEVYGDGRLLTSVEVGLGAPQEIDVSVENVLRLKLVQITLNDGIARAHVVWGDARLA